MDRPEKGPLFTCFEGFTDTEAAVAQEPLSLDCYTEIRATWKILKDTTGICGVADALIAACCYLSKIAETSNRLSPAKQCCVGVTAVLLGCKSWRTGS